MNSRLPRLTPVAVLLALVALAALCLRSSVAEPPVPVAYEMAEQGIANGRRPIAQGSEVGSGQASAGNKLLLQAAAQLERRASVSARLRHQISMAGKHFYGVGSYWQQGSGEDLRVRLELQIAGQDARLLQISNSRFLWLDRQLPTGRIVSRLDLRQLRADPVLSASSFDSLEPGSASWSPVAPELLAYRGGLPSLLAALESQFEFRPPQPMRLSAPRSPDSESPSIPVFAVVGHWKRERLSALLSKDADSITEDRVHGNFNSLPERLPQEVLLLVGQADLFPYRVEYRRLETPRAATGSAAAIPYQLSAAPLVVLELTDVAFDVPIAAGQFDYAPGDAEWVDQTASLLEQLRLRHQAELASRSSRGAH